jgi:uroporphyrinogen decarboxylase
LAGETHRIKAVTDDADQRAVVVPHVGPLTLAGHLIEGEAPWHPRLRALLFQYPTEARTLLTQAAGAILAYGRHIQRAGADALYLDDAWCAMLAPEDQSVFALPFIKQIVKGLAPFPVIVRAPGMDIHAEQLRKSGLSAWMPDMHTDASEIRNRTLHSLAILGPFEPGRLLSPIPVIKQAVGRLVEGYGERDFIVSLASTPLPHTDPRHLQAFVDAAKNISIQSI